MSRVPFEQTLLGRELTPSEQEIFATWKYRLNNYYFVKHEAKEEAIPFKMESYHEEALKRLIKGFIHQDIIKGRQVYFTTFSIVLMFDLCTSIPGFTCSFHNMTKEDALDTVKMKVHYIAKNSPMVHPYIDMEKSMTNDGIFFLNGSSITSGRSGRSHTNSFNLITEAAYTAQQYPDKYQELMDGMLQGSQHKMVWKETSPYGRDNKFIKGVKFSKDRENEGLLASTDFAVLFIPWWRKPANIARDQDLHVAKFNHDLDKYFATIEREENTQLSLKQRVWWYLKFTRDFSSSMEEIKREHPSTLTEALSQQEEAFIIAPYLKRAEEEGRVRRIPHDNFAPAYASWDFGATRSATAVTVVQPMSDNPGMFKIVHAYERYNELLQHFIKYLDDCKWRIERHFLPHDAEMANDTAMKITGMSYGTTITDFFRRNGMYNFSVIPRLQTGKQPGFEASAAFMGKVYICGFGAEPLLNSLRNVQRHFDEPNNSYKNELAKRGEAMRYNHLYDAFETMARAEAAGLLSQQREMGDYRVSENMRIDDNHPIKFDRNWDGVLL